MILGNPWLVQEQLVYKPEPGLLPRTCVSADYSLAQETNVRNAGELSGTEEECQTVVNTSMSTMDAFLDLTTRRHQ